MSENEDRPVSGAPVETVRDETPEQTVEGLDFEALVRGIRPTRRGVRVFTRQDLVDRMDRLVNEIDRLPDGPECDAKIDEYEQAKAEFIEGTWVTVEARSPEWVAKLRDTVATELGDDASDEDRAEAVTLRMMEAQIVSPAGATVESLRAMAEVAPHEFAKIAAAIGFVNNQGAGKSDSLSVDFSARRSGRRGTKRSAASSK